MLRKITLALFATAALATAALAPTSASAWWDGPRAYSWDYGWNYGWNNGWDYGSDYGNYYRPAYSFADSVAHCARRYRSYDPATGTFLGSDGFRHYCS